MMEVEEEYELKVNSFQTKITKELEKSLPREVYTELIDYVENVQFIRNLIAPEEVRGYIKDKPFMLDDDGNVYPDGRRQVDITNPHILEDMDYFRERAIYFNKYGKYTNIPVNPNPKSEYAKFWKDEVYKWKHGVVRPDGEWIPGDLYYYWNYSRIWLVEKSEDSSGKKSKKKGERKDAFPRPYLGDYLFFHYCDQAKNRGSHGKMLKARGIGASFKFASMSPRNMYVFPGSGNPNFHLASDKTFLTGDKGIWGKILDNLDWIATHTPLPKMRLIDGKKAMELQLGFMDDYGSRKGLLTSVYGISLKDNPDKARGIRGPLIHYEEDGLFPNLEKAWVVNRQATEEDGVAYGFMFAAGTGGTEGASFEGSEKLFYKPNAFNIYGIPNLFDKNTNGDSLCGFFWGAYLNRGNSTYENGECDVIQSLVNILMDRYLVKMSSGGDPIILTRRKAEEPITPQEAVMRTQGTLFPVSDLKDYLSEISPKISEFLSLHYIGKLSINSNTGIIEYNPSADIKIVREYPIKGNENKVGGIEIFELPKNVDNGKPLRFQYIAGIDPIDDDYSTTDSLGSIFVFDVINDRIVAEYTGRPRTANEFYENCYRLLAYYNAVGLYENDKKGLFQYFSNRDLLHYLADTPQVLKDMQMIKNTNAYGNKAKGVNSGKGVNALGRRLQADWMLEKASGDNGNKGLLNLHTIRSIGYLKEAIAWNPDGNFDRVSAMGMVMILRLQYYKYVLQLKSSDPFMNGSSHAEDPFFTKNWNNKQPLEKIMAEQNKSYKMHIDNSNVIPISGGKFKLK